MSKGHGATQRHILDQLDQHSDEHQPLDDFTEYGELILNNGCPPSFRTARQLSAGTTRAALESTKRAIRTLRDEGLVHTVTGRNHVVCVRLMPDEDTLKTWNLALEDHLYVRDRMDYYRGEWIKCMDRLKCCDSWEREKLENRKAWYSERARWTHGQVRDDVGKMLPSAQVEREAVSAEESTQAMGRLFASLEPSQS